MLENMKPPVEDWSYSINIFENYQILIKIGAKFVSISSVSHTERNA